jgi:ElaB/YqjD/DUF883 family membrane-anchored ribosome-binding protein
MNQESRTELQEGRDRLARDVRSVVDDAEQLLRAGAQGTGEAVAQARGRLEQSLAATREAIVRWERGAVERACAAGRATDSYVHEKPWQAIALSAAVGALVGVLLARRR